MAQAAAETAIVNANLTAGTVTEQHHATVPAGLVISQNPTSGSSVAPGTAVDIVLSDGPPAAPQSNFTANSVAGTVPLTVEFTDLSAPGDSGITRWYWSFGDDESSEEQNPVHVYSTPGTYDVSLAVTTAVGEDTETKHDFITVEGEQTVMLSYDVPLEMVWIPAGTFMMGRYPGEQDGHASEDPQHQVSVPGFWMAKYELTKRQWEAVMGTTPWMGLHPILDYQISKDPESPAVFVSWQDAKAFVHALVVSTGIDFRLPSEAEWEYASRAGTTTRFHWGDDPTYMNMNNYAWWEYTSLSGGHEYGNPVGQKLPNPFGLYDTSGNVFEWCEDDGHGNYIGAPTDGSAWLDSPRGSSRIVRGGYWNSQGDCRSAARSGDSQGTQYIGFRLAATFPANPQPGFEADFEADVTSGDVPLSVNFTDRSIPRGTTITAWLWDFGDGEESEEQNPTHTYQDLGTYDVSLTVTTAAGQDTETKHDFITVEGAQFFMLPGDVPLEMVWVPGGTFMMGRYPGEQLSYPEEDPRHQVSVPGFWMAKYELTKRQWQAVMGTTPWSGESNVLNDPDSPAVYISWNDAKAFIAVLNSYTSLTFRLPSEAEWEYACRAGTATCFYWGDDPNRTVGNAYCWWMHNARTVGEAYGHVVGQKIMNAFGLYDMSGNVWEWCEDDWHVNYTGSPTNGRAWVDWPRGSYRMLRGGSWYGEGACRSAHRGGSVPSDTSGEFGLRLAR